MISSIAYIAVASRLYGLGHDLTLVAYPLVAKTRYLDSRMQPDTEFTAAGIRVVNNYARSPRPGG